MPENTHTFEQGETFNGQLPDETIEVRQINEHTIVFDYIINGEINGRNTIEKTKARTFIRCGTWKPQLTEQ